MEKYSVRFAYLDDKDVELAFLAWCKSRFLPSDIANLYLSEFMGKIKSLDEIKIKQCS